MATEKQLESINKINRNPEQADLARQRLLEIDKDEVRTKMYNRRAFKYIFAQYLDDSKRTHIVKHFCDLMTSEKVPLRDRLHVFELVLRILGEDGTLSPSEYKELNSVITLKIE